MSSSEGFHRLALTIHYDGTLFHGWQIQAVERTVQGELESTLEKLTGEKRSVLGAGRTDTGVHATGQIAALDLPRRWSASELRRALNALLPRDIWVAEAREVSDDFHPRYDAIARSYEYRIGLADAAASPFHRPWCWPLGAELDRSLLRSGAERLLGEHSFKAFAKSGQPERGEICTVHSAEWSDWAGLGLRFRITANRYLHRMVRYLVGTMVDVGRGRRPEQDIDELLGSAATPLETSPPAPASGLFLSRVEYPSPLERANRLTPSIDPGRSPDP